MAKENVKLFFEALAKDEKLQSLMKEKEAAYVGDKEDREAIAREVVIPVAEASGYPFTIEEMKEVEESLINEGEINDLEAEAVSGGDSIGFCGIVGLGIGHECEFIGFGCCFIAGSTPGNRWR